MITVTAVTGRYARLVIDDLLRRGVPATDIVAAARSPEKAADFAERGVQVREADYDRPETRVPAFTGADKVLLIPSPGFGQRYPQMERAIKAAAEAGVGLIAYTSFVNTDTSTLGLGDEHKQTEARIRASGLPFVMLRNAAYTDRYPVHDGRPRGRGIRPDRKTHRLSRSAGRRVREDARRRRTARVVRQPPRRDQPRHRAR